MWILPIESAWFPPSPGAVLMVLIALCAVAAVFEAFARRTRRRQLRLLAAQWNMTYSPHDTLRVLTKISRHFPVPGAADLHVTDVIYAGQGDVYRYIFTAEFTIGAVRTKRRQVRVGTFCEPRGQPLAHAPAAVTLAPEHLTVLEQYQKLSPPVKTEGT